MLSRTMCPEAARATSWRLVLKEEQPRLPLQFPLNPSPRAARLAFARRGKELDVGMEKADTVVVALKAIADRVVRKRIAFERQQ